LDKYTKLKQRIQTYIDKYPLLDKKKNMEKFRLLKKLRNKKLRTQIEEDKLKQVRDELIVSNGGFGMKYAIIYCKKINDTSIIDDIFQEAQLGIIEALDKFDPDYGWNFPTYAYHYVKKNIIDYISNVNKIVSAPRDMARNIKNINEIYSKLWTKNCGDPISIEDIQDELYKQREVKLKKKVIDDILQLIELNSSVDQPFTNNLIDEICDDEDDSTVVTLLKTNILNDLIRLDKNVLDIVKMRFGINYNRPYTLDEIMVIMNIDSNIIEECKEITRAYNV